MIEVKLTTPVQHGEDLIEVIELRELTAGDIAKCGYPAEITDGGGVLPNADAIFKLIARLGRLPPHVVGKLSAKDFNLCMKAVMSFLGGGDGETESPA